MSDRPRQDPRESSTPREPEDPGAWDAQDDEELVLDPKHLLIVKDGTIRVAESLDDMQRDGRGDGAKAFGTWTRAEHERFLKAMEMYPKGPWKSIAEMVGTRTVRQTQTHAQKYREKMARRMRGLRNRNGTLQSPPTVPGAGASGAQVTMYPPAPSMPPPPSVHGDMATLAAIASAAPLLQGPPISVHYYPRTMPLRRMSAPLPSSIHSSMATSAAPYQNTQYRYPHHQLELSVQGQPPLLLRSASAFDELSQSSISSAFLGSACYPSTWEAYGAASEGKEEVPDFDESMDFLMDVYSSDPNQIGTTCVGAPPSERAEDGAGTGTGTETDSTAAAPFVRSDEPLRRRRRTG